MVLKNLSQKVTYWAIVDGILNNLIQKVTSKATLLSSQIHINDAIPSFQMLYCDS